MISKLYDKISKLPSWSGIVAVLVAAIVANIPLMLQFDVLWKSILASYVDAGLNAGNALSNLPDSYKYVVALISAVVTWGLVELVIYAVLWIISGSGRVREKKYFYNAVRFTYAAYKLIVGLFSLTAVYAPIVYAYAYMWINFSVTTVFFTFCYLGIKQSCINDNYVFNTYSRLYSVWFIYQGIVCITDFLFTMTDKSYTSVEKISSGVMLGLVAVAAAVLYFTVYRRLKKEQEENRRNFIPPPPPQSTGKGPDDEIFRGYGL